VSRFRDLDLLMGEARWEAHKPKKVEAKIRIQKPVGVFDADRFRWLLGTPAGLAYLSTISPNSSRSIQEWRDAIDKEILNG
jgi:hypothetical protein